MAEYCDHLSPAAEIIGAVNTVVNENGVLTGHTTDGIGYMQAAKDAGFDLTGKTMTLLGGGGAATDGCLIEDMSLFRPDLIVSDVIYNPEETKLLRLAREHGCRTFNGLYMLLYQGAAAFKLWTGQDMPVDVIKEKYFTR